MFIQEEFFGRSQTLTPGVDFDIVPQVGKVVLVTASVGSLKGKLPDARRFYTTGGPITWVFNQGANSFDIYDHNAATLVVAVAAGQVATILLTDNTTSNGAWKGYTKAKLT